MRQLTLFAVAAVVTLAACTEKSPIQPARPDNINALILDGAHSGNDDFFFLPPLVPNPVGSQNYDPGKFNPRLAPVVEVCELTGDPRLPPTASCKPGLVFGPAPMTLDAASEQYRLNWDTKGSLLSALSFYRITVRGAARGTELGFVDVDPVLGGMTNVRSGNVYAFQDGRTLPIKVRIEDGAFGSSNASDRVEQVVPSIIAGGTLDITTNSGFAGARFSTGWLPPGIGQVVVIIERVNVNNGQRSTSCLGLPLEELQGCYRFRTDPDLHGLGGEGEDLLFQVPVIAGVCFEIPDAAGHEHGPPFSLHRREEVGGVLTGEAEMLDDVPAPFLNCEGFTPTGLSLRDAYESGGLAAAARVGLSAVGRGIASLVTPRALHAVDLGAGGSTNEFSRFGWARPATMTKTTGDGESAPAGSTIDASVSVQNDHHGTQEAVAGQDVTFTITGGSGALIDGEGETNTLTVPTNADGNATVSWRLGPGENKLAAATTQVADTLAEFTATGETSLQFTDVTVGGAFSCATVINDSLAYCWGVNGDAGFPFGILGTFAASATCGAFQCEKTPVVIPELGHLIQISAGAQHVCAVTVNSEPYCWGRGNTGQLGNGGTDSSAIPVRVGGELRFNMVTAGGLFNGHTCGLTGAGVAYCWGENDAGQVGDGTTSTRLLPVPVATELTFTALSAGFKHTCGITSDQDIYCWGRNFFGQLGNGSNTDSHVPVLVAGERQWAAVSAGNEQTCAIEWSATGAGAAYCWGRNDVAQLGNGSSGDAEDAPVAVASDLGFITIGTSGFFSCAISADLAAYCWGRNDSGELGTGTFTAPATCTLLPGGTVPCATSPVAVTGGHSFFRLAANGVGDHACAMAIEEGGSAVYCWGRGGTGQLGNGGTLASATPVKVSGQ